MRRLVGLVAVALLAFATSAHAATWHRVGHASGSGDFPDAYAFSSPNHPVKLKLTGTATPTAPVEVHYFIDCYRGSRHRTVSRTLRNQTAPLSLKFDTTVRHPDFCGFSADLSYSSFDQRGHLVLDLYAKKRP